MKPETWAKLTIALIFVFVVGVAVSANAFASLQAHRAGIQGEAVASASAENAPTMRTSAAASTPAAEKPRIVVTSKTSGTITFADEGAVDSEIASTHKELRRFEKALRKDLTRGDFRAPHTRLAIGATGPLPAGSTAARLVATQRAFAALAHAMRTDIANGDFRAPHTRREVAAPRDTTRATGVAADAGGVVAVSEDVWHLEMSLEKDIHAHDLKARETHFAIDRRRW